MMFPFVLIIIGICVYTLYLFIGAIKDGHSLLLTSPVYRRLFLDNSEREVLRSYLSDFRYYNTLDEKRKEIFFDRVLTFSFSKNFVGKQGLVITDEIRILISASAVQLTFGLKRYRLNLLEDIYVYPGSFYSPKGDKEFKGAFFTSGKMMLSWEDFKQGYKIHNDRYNLGIHEMTHALKLALYSNEKFDTLFASYFDNWEDIAEPVYYRMKKGQEGVLRKYASTNKDEFFSVCVEHFFEDPHHLKSNLPDVYYHLCILLNQAPCNTDSSFVIDASIYEEARTSGIRVPLPARVMPNYKYHSWHWSLTLLLVGIGSAFFIKFFLYQYTVLPWQYFFIAPGVIGSVALVKWKSFEKSEALTFPQYVLFCFGGVGTTVFSLFLIFNYFTAYLNPHSKTYDIVSAYDNYYSPRRGGKTKISVTVNFRDQELDDIPGIRTFSPESGVSGRRVKYDYAYGFGGILMVTKRTMY